MHPVVYDALNQNLSLVIMPTLGTTLSLKKWLDSANLEWDRAVELNPDAERNLFVRPNCCGSRFGLITLAEASP